VLQPLALTELTRPVAEERSLGQMAGIGQHKLHGLPSPRRRGKWAWPRLGHLEQPISGQREMDAQQKRDLDARTITCASE